MSITLFDEILDQLEPFLTNEDLGFPTDLLDLQIYHLSVLPESATLSVLDFQSKVAYLSDVLQLKNQELDNISSSEKLDAENLRARQEKNREINQLNIDISTNMNRYVEALGDLQPGEFDQKIDSLYDKLKAAIKENKDKEKVAKYKKFLRCPERKLAGEIFNKINQALAAYNNKELGVTEESSEVEKK